MDRLARSPWVRVRDHKYETEIGTGKVTSKSIQAKGAFFILFQQYLEDRFPREIPTSVADSDRVLRMGFESEKLLRIIVEMILERNSTIDPDRLPQVEASDVENKLHGAFIPPSSDTIHALILLVTHLMARKVGVDQVLAANRTTRPVGRPCPALDVLHQPLFIFILLVFRNIKLESHAMELFLTVDLWLTWLQPWEVLNKLNAESLDRGMGPPPGYDKEYVQSNLHFYTTLLILFIRKMREAMSSPNLRHQETALLLLRRVLTLYRTEISGVVAETSEVAMRLWESQASHHHRGYDALAYH